MKKITPADELYAQLLKLYKELGTILAEYETKVTKRTPGTRKKVVLIDPRTGKEYGVGSSKKKQMIQKGVIECINAVNHGIAILLIEGKGSLKTMGR